MGQVLHGSAKTTHATKFITNYPKRSGACARVRLRDPGYGAKIVPRFGDFPTIRPSPRRPTGAVILLYS